MAHLHEETLASQRLYEGKILNLRRDTVRLENGSESVREVVEHSGGVCVAAITEDGDILLVRQLRYPYGEVVTELPAGKLSPGEDPLEAGKRELLEETGAVATTYRDLGKLYPSPGYLNEIIHLYLATELHFEQQQLDEDEFLDVVRMPLDEAVRLVLAGEIPDAKSQTAILKAHLLLSR